MVKANANLLEISQWDYKLTNATVYLIQLGICWVSLPSSPSVALGDSYDVFVVLILDIHSTLNPPNLRPKVVRDAYVSSMEAEGKELRDAKTAVELALSLGQSLKEPTEKLKSANDNYQKSSGQVKKACVAPKAKAKAKASA